MGYKNYRIRFVQVFFLFIMSFAILKISYAQEELSNEEMLYEINGYAIASCLIKQDDMFLKRQGEFWAEAVLQYSSKYDFEALRAISDAARKEISKTDMFMAKDETTPYKAKALPIYYCYIIASKPSVQKAILEAYTPLKKLSRLSRN